MDDIATQFNQIATKYDSQRPLLVPGFYDYYGASLDVLKYNGNSPRILDLGCGTGLLSAFLVEKYPMADLTLIDMAEDMLEVAKERFGDRDSPTTFLVGDYTTYMFEHQFDLIVSGLSIHHLTHDEKERLFQKCYDMLGTGGEFLNIDQVLSPTQELEERYSTLWKNRVRESSLSEREVEKAFERIKLDNPSTLFDQMEWLRKAGFSTIDPVYKYWYFCSIYASRS